LRPARRNGEIGMASGRPAEVAPLAGSPMRGLAPHHYTDPAIYQRELRGLLSTTWQYAGHISELVSPGDYFTFEIAGENLFCVLDGARNVRAFYNVCQHRAHELVAGRGNTRQIICPYHSWTYRLDGRLRSGPNLKSVPGFDVGEICLTSVRTEVFLGFVFVNLHADAVPMEQWFPAVREEICDFVPHINRLAPMQRIAIEERCNWKVAVENYSECYHCRKNHPTFSTGVIKPDTYDIQPQGHCLRHTTECQHLDRMTYEIDLDANPHAGHYSSWYLWPTFSFQVYPGNVLNTYHWQPQAVDRVRVVRGWYTVGGVASETIKALARQDRETTMQEDISLVESVQRGLQSRGYSGGPLVIDPRGGLQSEHSIRALHGWMREATGTAKEPSA